VFNCAALVTAWHFRRGRRIEVSTLAALVFANIVHVLAFPSYDLRFFAGTYIAIGCIVFVLYSMPAGVIDNRRRAVVSTA